MIALGRERSVLGGKDLESQHFLSQSKPNRKAKANKPHLLVQIPSALESKRKLLSPVMDGLICPLSRAKKRFWHLSFMSPFAMLGTSSRVSRLSKCRRYTAQGRERDSIGPLLAFKAGNKKHERGERERCAEQHAASGSFLGKRRMNVGGISPRHRAKILIGLAGKTAHYSKHVYFLVTEKVHRPAADGAGLLPPGPPGEGLLRPPVHRPLQRAALARPVKASQEAS